MSVQYLLKKSGFLWRFVFETEEGAMSKGPDMGIQIYWFSMMLLAVVFFLSPNPFAGLPFLMILWFSINSFYDEGGDE